MRAQRTLGVMVAAAALTLAGSAIAQADDGPGHHRKPSPPVLCPACNFTTYVSVGSRLSGKDFANAFLAAAYAAGQDLSNSNFKGAAFNQATLTTTNLTNSDFTNADFTSADLTGAVTTGAKFNGAIWSNTTCPDGTNSNVNGGTCIGHLS
jgi:uncharacterized protein YjbI with pentapeptide repeats